MSDETSIALTTREGNHQRDTEIVNALTGILEVCPVKSDVAGRVQTLMTAIVATMGVEVIEVSASREAAQEAFDAGEAAFKIGADFSRMLATLKEIVEADAAARQVDYFAESGVTAAQRRVEALAAGRELVDEFIKPIRTVEDPNGPFTFAGIEAAIDPRIPEGHIGIDRGDDVVELHQLQAEEAREGCETCGGGGLVEKKTWINFKAIHKGNVPEAAERRYCEEFGLQVEPCPTCGGGQTGD